MKARRLDEPGVNRIFDMFDELKDKITRIEVGGRGFLKALLTHKCFEPIVARAGSRGTTMKGTERSGVFCSGRGSIIVVI